MSFKRTRLLMALLEVFGINRVRVMHDKYHPTELDWQEYWRKHDKENVIKKLFFEKYMKYFPNNGSLIELGGFPGIFAGYFKSRFNYDVAILDKVIITERVRNVEILYKLPENSINTIKADVYEYKCRECFEIVTSFGFIEHFEDTKSIMKIHADLLKTEGILLATLPNFRGLNGFIQKHMDPTNYAMHNVKSMDIKYLTWILNELKFSYYEVAYVGRPTIWLEPDAKVATLTRKCVKFAAYILCRLPFINNRILAPHILIWGVK